MNSTLLFVTYKYRGTHPSPCGLSNLKLQNSRFAELHIIQQFVVTINTDLVFDWVGSLDVSAHLIIFFDISNIGLNRLICCIFYLLNWVWI